MDQWSLVVFPSFSCLFFPSFPFVFCPFLSIMAYYLSSLVRSVVSGRSVLDSFAYTVAEQIHETPLWKVHNATKKVQSNSIHLSPSLPL